MPPSQQWTRGAFLSAACAGALSLRFAARAQPRDVATSKKGGGLANERFVDRFLVLDAHCDSVIFRQARGVSMDLAVPQPRCVVDLAILRQAGVGCIFSMVGESSLRQSSLLLDATHAMCAAHPADFAVCRTGTEVRAARAAGQVAIVITTEGQRMFAEDLHYLRNWHRLGVRVAGLTHGEGGVAGALQHEKSLSGYIQAGEREAYRRQSKGLTPFARESVQEMARLRMSVDVAHCNDAAFWQVLELSAGPVCYTHGACYSLCPHARCLTDEMMRALAKRDGVMGIAFSPTFISTENPTIEKLCDHFMHALEVMGPAHVGIGTDFDGLGPNRKAVPEDPRGIETVLATLAGRGVNDDTLRRIAGENFLRLLPA